MLATVHVATHYSYTAPTPPLHRTEVRPRREGPPRESRRRRRFWPVPLPKAAAVADAPAPRRWPSMRTAYSFLTLLPAYHGTYQATPPCTASRPTRCSPSDSTRSSACARSLSSPSSPPSPAGSATRSAERGDVKSRVGVRGTEVRCYGFLAKVVLFFRGLPTLFGFCHSFVCTKGRAKNTRAHGWEYVRHGRRPRRESRARPRHAPPARPRVEVVSPVPIDGTQKKEYYVRVLFIYSPGYQPLASSDSDVRLMTLLFLTLARPLTPLTAAPAGWREPHTQRPSPRR